MTFQSLHGGFWRDMQRNAALSPCLTCAESPHGGFVDGPCAWSGCPLRVALNGARPADPDASRAAAPFHEGGNA